MEKTNPKTYSLPATTVLNIAGKDRIAIVIDRKSRIVMADGKKILEKAEKIKAHDKTLKICLQTTAPVCSKTIRFLKDKGIAVLKK